MAQRPFHFVPALVLLLVVCAPAQGEGHSMMSKIAGDTRQPLPLPAMMAEHQKQNMREHLAAVQAIIAAIARDEMDAVAKATASTGHYEDMGQMCEHMGAAAPDFLLLREEAWT